MTIAILNCYNNKTSEPISIILASFKDNFMLPTMITQNDEKKNKFASFREVGSHGVFLV